MHYMYIYIHTYTYRLDRELWDYKKVGIHVNQFMGSSSSIGAKRVRNVCVAFRAASEQNNRPGYSIKLTTFTFSLSLSTFPVPTLNL